MSASGRNKRGGRSSGRKPSGARHIALAVLSEWRKSGEYVDRLLHDALRLSRLDRRDRGFVTEIVCGVFRNQGRLDLELTELCTGDFSKLPEAVIDSLRLGLYQIRFLDRIPMHAAVGETVEALKRTPLRGMAGLVNGVLRNAARREPLALGEDAKERELSQFYSLPQWLFASLIKQIGREETVRFAEASLAVPPLYARANQRKATVEDVLGSLKKDDAAGEEVDGVPGSLVVDSPMLPDELAAHREGLIQIQDASSTLIGHLCRPAEQDVIVDACCAPGGKLAHLADGVGADSQVYGFDRSELRLELTRENLQRLGLGRVKLECRDLATDEDDWSVTPSLLLLDVPCTGTGTFRRRVDLKWRLDEEDVVRSAEVQEELLENGARRLAPGGRIVYSTCSILEQENENVVLDFLGRHPEFRLQHARELLPEESHRFIDGEGFLRTWPQRDGFDGIFAASLIRDVDSHPAKGDSVR